MGITFIGLGLSGADSLSLQAIKTIKGCHKAYVERYTSPLSDDLLKEVGAVAGKDIIEVRREFVEDGRSILDEASLGEVVLLSPGDPMVATTHAELRIRADEKGIKTKIIHSSSIINVIPGEFGLHTYNFGKVVTMTSQGSSSVNTVYETVYKNLLRGLHTIVLLEYSYPRSFVMPKDALKVLLEKEEEQRLGALSNENLVLVASRLGSREQSLQGGKVGALLEKDSGEPPHTMIIPGRLHFTEAKALRVLTGMTETEIVDNSSRVKRLSFAMVTKYVPKTMRALETARSRAGDAKELVPIFENVEAYAMDAERFLHEGRDELAILSIAYAEGLLDSVRLMRRLEIEW